MSWFFGGLAVWWFGGCFTFMRAGKTSGFGDHCPANEDGQGMVHKSRKVAQATLNEGIITNFTNRTSLILHKC
jgi:hypothetical protein